MSTTEQKPFLGGKARSWVPRACDRCRKRKARCDEAVPCKNCADAGAKCTHDAPVLKRGPRPRQQTQDLESRLRNLEHLISSIPSGGSGGSASLSSGELDQIRAAAAQTTTTPGSDASPHDAWMELAGSASGSTFPQPGSRGATAGPSQPFQSFSENGQLAGFGYPGQPASGAYQPWPSSLGESSSLSMSKSNQGPSSSGYNPSMGNVPGPPGFDQFSAGGAFAIPDQRFTGNVKPAQSGPGQEILYKDVEGQTKFLGPSSGMPLLDRLKATNDQANPQQPGMSQAEEWVSLSAAIGVDVERQPLPGPSRMSSPRAGPNGLRAEDDGPWLALLALVPQDLVDHLVRGYFTISHLLWPILHAPTFMEQYANPNRRKQPTFVALVLSICCLSSRYVQDSRLPQPDASGDTLASRLLTFAKDTVGQLAAERTDLEIVQALFNMSVVQEGTARPNLMWTYLSQALSGAIELGLHRRVDNYSSFNVVDLEVRKRTMWALYAQDIKASCTFGRPPMLRLTDLDLDEPAAVDDVYISVETGIGQQPVDRPSVMAGFVCAVRLHMIIERLIRRINRSHESANETQSFKSLAVPLPRVYAVADELDLLPRVTDGIPGDWTYTPATIAEPDSVSFFQKTRVFTLMHFVRLLVSRHQFSELLVRLSNDAPTPEQWAAPSPADESQPILQTITQSALGIIGTYCVIDTRGRLGFFGAHAIAQLTQAGAGLIGVILHLRSTGSSGDEAIWHLALQGLPAAIQVLRQLGKRRAAGNRSAELLAEFSRACRIPVFTGPNPSAPMQGAEGSPGTRGGRPVEVPMLRTLPRRPTNTAARAADTMDMTDLPADNWEDWLGLALSGSRDAWMTASEQGQAFQ